MEHTPSCFAAHMGLWAIETSKARTMLAAIRSGLLVANESNLKTSLSEKIQTVDGIRVIPISGTMMRAPSKFGGTSTVDVRREIARANRDSEVSGIALLINSPGGHVAGMEELTDAIGASQKQIRSYIQDIGASAAYWAAAGTHSISMSRMSSVGSIGVFAVLEDVSKALDEQGVELHVVSSGGVKGAGADGRVTEEVLEETQKQVDFINGFFAEAVRAGRGMDEEDEEAVHTGQMYTPTEALELGLVDSVESFGDFMTTFAREVAPKKGRSRMAIAEERLRKYQ